MSQSIMVGRVAVDFACRADERIECNPSAGPVGRPYCAGLKIDGVWRAQGWFATWADAARALYVDRGDFTAAYGA